MKSKKQQDRQWVIEKLNLNNLSESDLQRLILIESDLIKYIDLNKITDSETLAYCVDKRPKKLKEINTFNKPVLKTVLYSDDIKLKDCINYINLSKKDAEAQKLLEDGIREFMLAQYESISIGFKLRLETREKMEYIIINYPELCKYDFTFKDVKDCNTKSISRELARFILKNTIDKTAISLVFKNILTWTDYRELGII